MKGSLGPSAFSELLRQPRCPHIFISEAVKFSPTTCKLSVQGLCLPRQFSVDVERADREPMLVRGGEKDGELVHGGP